jgi:hypothetical protein
LRSAARLSNIALLFNSLKHKALKHKKNSKISLAFCLPLRHHKHMVIDTVSIDGEIRRLEEQLQVLRDLKRIASNPNAATIMEKFVSSNGSQLPAMIESSPSPPNPVSRGDLTRAVLNACRSIGSKFGVNDVISKMRETGFVFAAHNPQIAVNGVLRKLVNKGYIKLVSSGTGRIPSIYEQGA